MKKYIKSIMVLLVLFCLAMFIKKKLLMIAYIPSESMESTLKVGDLVASNHLAYLFSDPERGDIIIFPAPFEDDTYIKRIIGLPGETVSFKDGSVYIDGIRLEEDYVKEKWSTKDIEDIQFVVPENSYFVLGDNRNFSFDARYWWQEALDEGFASSKEEAMNYSFVKKEDIIAKGWIKIYKGIKLF